jgi:hypothetical protein
MLMWIMSSICMVVPSPPLAGGAASFIKIDDGIKMDDGQMRGRERPGCAAHGVRTGSRSHPRTVDVLAWTA